MCLKTLFSTVMYVRHVRQHEIAVVSLLLSCVFIIIYRTLSNWVYEFDKWAPSVVKVSYKVSLSYYSAEKLQNQAGCALNCERLILVCFLGLSCCSPRIYPHPTQRQV